MKFIQQHFVTAPHGGMAWEVDVPQGASLLDVQATMTGMVFWFWVDPAQPQETWRFFFALTNAAYPELSDARTEYVATVRLAGFRETLNTLHVFDISLLETSA